MSILKFAPDLFLEQQELNRLRKFLDDEGFRINLIDNTQKWGLIDKQSFYPDNSVKDQFTNALITEDVGLTIKHNPIRALNADGRLIYRAATNQIAVTGDNNWYWVKISWVASPIELGVWALDADGNLTGTGGELLTILRGEPNFPSRIKFTNAINNTAEYDVVEVIDDNNAILNGVSGTFNVETGLELAVVGTFTEGVAPPAANKYPFQYDSCVFELILEATPNTPPTLVEGQEFVIARVKSDGVTMVIQDKRVERWTTKANYRLSKVDEVDNPLIGVGRIMFDHEYSTKDRNKVFMQWAFQSTNYTVNTNLNIITINAGSGGNFKTVADFTDGDFNGWRLYATNGKYLRIVNSVLTGGQINCYFDSLEVDYFSTDGGSTFTGSQIVITPDAEKIEIVFDAQDISSTSVVETFPNLEETFEFNINEVEALCPLLVYDDPVAYYSAKYRYKTNDTYTEYVDLPEDTSFGYYTENAYEDDGSLKPIVLANSYAQNVAQGYIKTYTGGVIELILHGTAYYPLLATIVTGDRLGVDRVTLNPAITPPYTLVVGANRIYQYFEGGPFSLTQDFFINIENTGAINGNRFFLHFANEPQLNGFRLRIVTNFVNISTFDLIEEFTTFDDTFASLGHPVQFEVRHDGTQWEVEHSTYDRGLVALEYLQILFVNALVAANAADITALQAFQADVESAWTSFSSPTTRYIDQFGLPVNGTVLLTSGGYKIVGRVATIQIQVTIDTITGNSGTGFQWIEVDLPAALENFGGAAEPVGMCKGARNGTNIFEWQMTTTMVAGGGSTVRFVYGNSMTDVSPIGSGSQTIRATFQIGVL